jgi:hypothetical protein
MSSRSLLAIDGATADMLEGDVLCSQSKRVERIYAQAHFTIPFSSPNDAINSA